MWPRVGARVLDNLVVNLVILSLGVVIPLPDGNAYWLLSLAILVAYETVLLANGGQTPAKMLLGIRVVRVDRAPLSLRDALVRSVTIGGTALVPLGLVVCALLLEKDRQRRGWHDKAAGTLVVRTRYRV